MNEARGRAATGHTAGIDRAAFLKRAAALGLLASTGALAGAPAAGAATAREHSDSGRGLTYRGVAYDTGTSYFPPELTRPLWSTQALTTDMDAIDRRLHCNYVNVFGTVVERLVETSAAALKRGLAVSIQPRLFDHPQERILSHLARTAREAEKLRRAHDPEVVLVVGCEHILFTPGIVPGDTFMERIRYLTEEVYDFEEILRRLDAFLGRAAAVARRHFHGRVTYGSAAGFEEVDWSRFDIVGLDYYSYHRDPAEHTEELRPYRRWNKPIMILEFGCCTYRGAAKRGGDGWDVVDWDKPVPEIKGKLVRSEREQADHIAFMLDVFESEGFLSASPYEFIAVDSPHSPVPEYDLDMASYGLVKVIRKDLTDPASPYRWEPKLSFHAVARHNRAACGG
ncbi:abortive phage infection protein [Wenjunlia tyrosinilytica]|uniref:Abortive phage infection protein n=1 Tax=Wenjunlia tyrosinilytica TaxID=1544741 RepID=A0A917ZR50_9ACTN|nr:abortive phage infection protein [Wenjunlia tyrosinilytica]GGO90606.1 hypothetical protein GCM10012280_36510 [Wenjunlia tyrosinilytica]